MKAKPPPGCYTGRRHLIASVSQTPMTYRRYKPKPSRRQASAAAEFLRPDAKTLADVVDTVWPPVERARAAGLADGKAGNRRRAARWPPGTYGHGDYELGQQQAELGQQQAELDLTDPRPDARPERRTAAPVSNKGGGNPDG